MNSLFKPTILFVTVSMLGTLVVTILVQGGGIHKTRNHVNFRMDLLTQFQLVDVLAWSCLQLSLSDVCLQFLKITLVGSCIHNSLLMFCDLGLCCKNIINHEIPSNSYMNYYLIHLEPVNFPHTNDQLTRLTCTANFPVVCMCLVVRVLLFNWFEPVQTE